ncbi:MAG: PAS domain S-box protein, partial [Aquihabitans sp.]
MGGARRNRTGPSSGDDPGSATPAPTSEGPARSAALPPVSEAIAAAFLGRFDDLMLLLGPDGTIRWASPSCERFCGQPAAQVIGTDCADLLEAQDRERVRTAIRDVVETQEHAPVEGRLLGDGRTSWVELVLTNLLDEPDVLGIVAHLRDISERRRAEEAVQLQASVLDAVGQAIAVRDLDGVAVFWNPAATALFGHTAEEVLGRRMGDVISPAPGYEQQLQPAGRAHLEARPWSGVAVISAKDGTVVRVQTTSTPLFDRDGKHVGTITASHDLSEILEQQRRSEDDRRRLADAQASANLGSFELDLRTGEFHASAEFWRIVGRPPSNLGALEHVHPDDLAAFTDAFLEARAGVTNVACTHRIVRPDGTIRWVTTRTSQFDTADREIVAGTVLDITEHHEAQLALAHRAAHDPLTGLLHSRIFLEQLTALLARPPDAIDQVALLFIDLDHFKAVNDRLGHVDADDVLRQLGGRIAGVLPDTAILGRLGGDEFVVCVDRLRDDEAVNRLVEDVQAAIRRPLEARTTVVSLDASIGIAVAGTERRAKELLRNADLAMYEAKRRGRGRAEPFSETLAEQERRRTRLADDLRTALDHGGIEAYYQPEFELTSGSLFGFEALARWTHPELGRIGPDEFIPLAEEAGLIGALGRQMLANAGACLARWNRRWPARPLTIGVNVSPHQLSDPAFTDEVRRIIGDNGL